MSSTCTGHPAEQLAGVMSRLYKQGLTTTSGGNLSVVDDKDTLWITPGGVDKANLTPEDIISISSDGRVTGRHRPSLETKFHQGLYQTRGDVKAVIHAHAPAGSAFCISRQAPMLEYFPQIFLECGKAVMTGYAAPGSPQLSDAVSMQAAKGRHVMLLDNHGSLTVGDNLLHALQRFEALEVCSRALIQARHLGDLAAVPGNLQELLSAQLKVPEAGKRSADYASERRELCSMAARACRRGLMTSSLGSMSLRVNADAFLITPFGKDRSSLNPEEAVLVDHGCTEPGKQPDLWTAVHRALYAEDSRTRAVMCSSAPSLMAYAVTASPYDTRELTEGYMMLREIALTGLADVLERPDEFARMFSDKRTVQLVAHGGAAAAGTSLLEVLDRIEVAEVSMQAGISALQIGGVHRLSTDEAAEISDRFHLP